MKKHGPLDREETRKVARKEYSSLPQRPLVNSAEEAGVIVIPEKMIAFSYEIY